MNDKVGRKGGNDEKERWQKRGNDRIDRYDRNDKKGEMAEVAEITEMVEKEK